MSNIGTVSFGTSPLVVSLQHFEWISSLISNLDSHLALDCIFMSMITFIVSCHFCHKQIAKLQSNPYTLQLPWNFGPNSFNFQLLNYDVYHASLVCRWAHHLTIAAEAFLWLLVIRATFGLYGLAVLSLVLAAQAFSYRDIVFGAVLATIWSGFAIASNEIVTNFFTGESDYLMLLTKKTIFVSVLIRTLSHVLEATPPIVNVDNDKFGVMAFWFAFTNPARSFFAFIFGIISEMASGIPGRLFPVVVYYALSSIRYRSSNLMNIGNSRDIGDSILASGWSSYPLTASIFKWARDELKVVPCA